METPKDGSYGALVNGSWTGFKGLLQREVEHVHSLTKAIDVINIIFPMITNVRKWI